MEAPTSVKIWVPAGQEAFDATAEPTLEDQNGSDILGNAIADTEQAINALDGRPGQLLTVDTSGERSTWRIDLEANLRKTYDALMVDAHNLLSAYPLAIRDLLNIYKHTADDDALASATEVVYSKILSGLLGKGRPRLHFDEIDDYVTISDDADLQFGSNTDFSHAFIFQKSSVPSTANIIIGKRDAGNDSWEIQILTSGKLRFYFGDGAETYFFDTTQNLCDGDPHMVVFAIDRDVSGYVFVDDGADEAAGKTGTITDIDDCSAAGTDVRWGNKPHNTSFPLGGYLALGLIYNRCLSEADSATLYANWTHTPIPIADRGGSQTAKNVNNCVNGTYTTFDGLSPTGFHAVWGAGVQRGGTVDEITFVAGRKYAFFFTMATDSGQAPSVTAREALGGALISDVHTATSGDNYHEFTALKTATGLIDFANSGAAEYTISNLKAYQIGCVAEYIHDGISKDLTKWLDASGNDLHGTVTGCEYVDTPDGTDLGFYLAEFTAVIDWLFWFLQFVQNDGATNASADTYLGWLPLLKSYTFGDLVAGGYSGDHSFGITSRVSDVGRVLAEEIHGEQPSWNLTWRRLTATQWADLVEMLRIIKPGKDFSLYPFYICFNYDTQDPVIWRVRMAGPLGWAYNGANTYKWSPTMTVIRDL